jgi:hypothetical protein
MNCVSHHYLIFRASMCNYIAVLLGTLTSNYCLHETRLIFCLCDVTELAVTVDNGKINMSSKKINEEISRTVDTELTHVSDSWCLWFCIQYNSVIMSCQELNNLCYKRMSLQATNMCLTRNSFVPQNI